MSRIERTPEQLKILRGANFDAAVALEFELQRQRWGEASEASNTAGDWLIILQRELGEAAERLGNLRWDSSSPSVARGYCDQLRLELAQVGAVCRSIHVWATANYDYVTPAPARDEG